MQFSSWQLKLCLCNLQAEQCWLVLPQLWRPSWFGAEALSDGCAMIWEPKSRPALKMQAPASTGMATGRRLHLGSRPALGLSDHEESQQRLDQHA